MKRYSSLILALSVFAFILPRAYGADPGEEDRLIAALQSDHSPQEKDAACSRLKWIGTARCVPAVAALLADEQLSHSARYALESMPLSQAADALLQALSKTSGSNQVGIINSLAVRRETRAVPDLGKLLSGADTNAAAASAMALGRIGGPQALKALQAAWSDFDSGPAHEAEIDGLLACANELLTDGKDSQALKIFQRLYDSGKNSGTRDAAYRGMILASGRRGIELMTKAIAGNDGDIQGAALQAANMVKGPEATRALAELLPSVAAPVQIALLHCLEQRGDPSALAAVAHEAGNSDSDVRLAAITALGTLGDGSVALLLAEKAALGTGAEKTAARLALVDLRRGNVTSSLLESFVKAAPEVQLELIRALGDRGDLSAAPRLLELARSQNASTRSSSFQALALLAGPAQIPDLVNLVVQAATADARSEAVDALNSACQRIESRSGHCEADALVKAVQTGPLEARLALLPVCAGLVEAPARAALRAALEDTEPRSAPCATPATASYCPT